MNGAGGFIFIRKANFARGMPEKLMEEVILVSKILLELLCSELKWCKWR